MRSVAPEQEPLSSAKRTESDVLIPVTHGVRRLVCSNSALSLREVFIARQDRLTHNAYLPMHPQGVYYSRILAGTVDKYESDAETYVHWNGKSAGARSQDGTRYPINIL